MSKNFKYLDNLIHSGKKEIILEHDIKIKLTEQMDYLNGIPLDLDDIVIDGNGHTINGNKKAQIFNISGKNVTIKNLTLKNGLKRSGGIQLIYRDKDIKSRGGAILNNGEVNLINCKIINNFGRFGGGILNLGTMTIKDCILKNNSSNREGGAISNTGKLKIFTSMIEQNTAKDNGGAITNAGELIIIESKILKNKTGYNDDRTFYTPNGTIENGGKLTIKDSFFENNISENGGVINNGGVEKTNNEAILEHCIFQKNQSNMNRNIIENWNGNMKIRDCEFSKNTKENNIIYNQDSLEINNTVFKENDSKKIIYNHMDSKLGIFGGAITKNSINESLIFNTGKSLLIKKTVIEGNTAKTKEIINIENESDLTLDEPKINDEGKTILNKGTTSIKSENEDLVEKIDNQGSIKFIPTFKKGECDFSHLDDLIQDAKKSDEKTIRLSHNISLKDYEKDFFEGGIELDVDDLTIEGNGKIIDGSNQSRIFHITGKNITLKNITFQNGCSHNSYDNLFNSHGGALWVHKQSNLNIEECKFLNNDSEYHGGAIYNRGEISIGNTSFLENNSQQNGGALYNLGISEIQDCKLQENSSMMLGGAVYNNKKIDIDGSAIEKNIVKGNIDSCGGGIYNNGNMNLRNSIIANNEIIQRGLGGGIYNEGEGRIFNCRIYNNSAWRGGGISGGELEIKDTVIEKNKGTNGAGFRGGKAEIINCKFIDNDANKTGGAIEVTGSIDLIKTSFKHNTALDGGAIHYDYIDKYTPVNEKECTFEGNSPNDYSTKQIYDVIPWETFKKEHKEEQETMDKLFVYSTFLSKSKLELLNTILSELNSDEDNDSIKTISENKIKKSNERDYKNLYNVDDSHSNKIKIGSFTYLNDLIGKNSEIKFDQDIIFDEETDNSLIDGITIGKDLIIDGNGYSMDGKSASSFFEISKDFNVTFKNIRFVNASSKNNSLIVNDGNLNLENCEFQNNNENGEDGLIINKNSMKIFNLKCFNNSSKLNSIINNKGYLEIFDSEFYNNSSYSGGAIYNQADGKIDIRKSKFNDNNAQVIGGAIANYGKINVNESIFTKNTANSGGAINNQSDSHIDLCNCEFNENNSQQSGGAIANWGKFSSEESSFTKNTANQDGGAIGNVGEMIISYAQFNENHAEKNAGAIINWGNINSLELTFTKNTATDGGAINNSEDGKITFRICEFNENHAEKNGGTILNFGKIELSSCRLKENDAINGGAINSQKGKISIDNTKFIENESVNGAAIINFDVLDINNSHFEENKAKKDGGALFNQGTAIQIENTVFSRNYTENYGGAMLNFGNVDILKSIFDSNNAGKEGGAINNQMNGSLNIRNSEFIKNRAKLFGAIYCAKSESYTLDGCKFEDNVPDTGINIE